MEEQLELVERRARIWKLDPPTRVAGFRGIAEARRALQSAKPAWRHPDDVRNDTANQDELGSAA